MPGALHIAVVAALAVLVAAWAGVAWFGDNVFSAYRELQCNSTFYDDVQVVREISTGFMVGGIFMLAIGAYGLARGVWNWSKTAEIPLMTGVALVITSGLLAFLVGLTGSCKYETGGEGNGEIRDLQVFAGFVGVIGILGAVLTDVTLGSERGEYTIASTTGMQFVLWAVSMIITGYLVHIMTRSDTYFRDHYVPWRTLITPECQYAVANQTDINNAEHKRYEKIELGSYTFHKWK